MPYEALGYFCALQMTLSSMHAGRQGWGQKQVRSLAAELVEGLSGMGRPADAAAVAVGYLNDAEGAVALFCQAHEWREVGQCPTARNMPEACVGCRLTVVAPAKKGGVTQTCKTEGH